MVQLNASMPLLGVYEDLDVGATSSSYTFPVDDPHSAAFGLLMREALDAYAEEAQDPSAHWTDFTLLDEEVTHPDGAALTADAVVAWLKERAGTLHGAGVGSAGSLSGPSSAPGFPDSARPAR